MESMIKKVIENNQEMEDLYKKSLPVIKIVGCGGAGCNTLTRLYELGVVGAETIAVNTEVQHLSTT